MTSLSDVYEKFGEVAEAAQLLETELGTMLLAHECLDADLIQTPDTVKANEIFRRVNKHTLGRLISLLNAKQAAPKVSSSVIEKALDARNFLSHSFYRYHNFRRNSPEGRAIMLEDLRRLHNEILQAYLELLASSGGDVDADQASALPTKWVRI